MDELFVLFGFAIVTWVIYSVFELFVRRKERLMIIEKMNSENWGKGINPNFDIFPKKDRASIVLSIGLLLMGIGLGMLVGYLIYISNIEYILQLTETNSHRVSPYEFKNMIVGSCTLLFGGAALLAAYLIERRKK